uniref:protein ZBED8-like n=1 Tax=Styela clava TaxID=7725 RepID=UPI0019397013|nr:protein ZBED8-like [Styela clava]
MLFCKPLETTTKAEDVFEAVAAYFDSNAIKWGNLMGICTDGAPAMLGSRSGFVSRMKQRSPNAIGTRCVIHKEALASRTLPPALEDKLAVVIRIVNFVKATPVKSRLFARLCKNMDSDHEALLFHTAVRWLSKSNMLSRVYEMSEEVKLFLEAQGKQDLLLSFASDSFQLGLAYLVDIFEALNLLNRLLQGNNTSRIDHYDAIHTFIAKLGLWLRRVERGNAASFSTLDKNKADLEGKLKTEVEAHLQLLKQEFERYFPDLANTVLPDWKMARNSFRLNEAILPDAL